MEGACVDNHHELSERSSSIFHEHSENCYQRKLVLMAKEQGEECVECIIHPEWCHVRKGPGAMICPSVCLFACLLSATIFLFCPVWVLSLYLLSVCVRVRL